MAGSRDKFSSILEKELEISNSLAIVCTRLLSVTAESRGLVSIALKSSIELVSDFMRNSH